MLTVCKLILSMRLIWWMNSCRSLTETNEMLATRSWSKNLPFRPIQLRSALIAPTVHQTAYSTESRFGWERHPPICRGKNMTIWIAFYARLRRGHFCCQRWAFWFQNNAHWQALIAAIVLNHLSVNLVSKVSSLSARWYTTFLSFNVYCRSVVLIALIEQHFL